MAVTQIAMGNRHYIDVLIEADSTGPEEGVAIPEGKRFVGFSLDNGFNGVFVNWFGSTNNGASYGTIDDWAGDELVATIRAADETRHIPVEFKFFEMCTHIKPVVDTQVGDTTMRLAFS